VWRLSSRLSTILVPSAARLLNMDCTRVSLPGMTLAEYRMRSLPSSFSAWFCSRAASDSAARGSA